MAEDAAELVGREHLLFLAGPAGSFKFAGGLRAPEAGVLDARGAVFLYSQGVLHFPRTQETQRMSPVRTQERAS